MARRAISPLFHELSSLRNEVNILSQQVRIAVRPRLDLEQLIPGNSTGTGLRVGAPDFAPCEIFGNHDIFLDALDAPLGVKEELRNTGNEACGKTNESLDTLTVEEEYPDSRTDPLETKENVAGPAEEHEDPRFFWSEHYLRSHIRGIGIHCLPSLVGIWEPIKKNISGSLPDDQVLDSAIQEIQDRDCIQLSSWMDAYPALHSIISKVFPRLIKQHETDLAEREAH